MTDTCRSCRFGSPSTDRPDNVNGVCRKKPPVVLQTVNDATTSGFPPVNLDTFWCGEFTLPKRWWEFWK